MARVSILLIRRRATGKAARVTEEGGIGVGQRMLPVQESDNAVRKFTEGIRETTMAGRKIVVSVRQEAHGIDRIATAKQGTNESIHQLLDATDQSESVSERLSEVAAEMRDSISEYRI